MTKDSNSTLQSDAQKEENGSLPLLKNRSRPIEKSRRSGLGSAKERTTEREEGDGRKHSRSKAGEKEGGTVLGRETRVRHRLPAPRKLDEESGGSRSVIGRTR